MEKEEFLRRVFSVNTEAGFKLRYLITKATCCKKYAKKIGFTNQLPNVHSAKKCIIKLFVWKYTPEGATFWSNVYDDLWDLYL